MRQAIPVSVVVCLLSGCASAPKPIWLRADGQIMRENPVLAHEFELARTSCLGERQKAALSGVTVHQGGFGGIVAAAERGQAADQVAQGCMAEKGYLLSNEEQARAKQQELAAIAEMKKQQEAAAAKHATVPAKRR